MLQNVLKAVQSAKEKKVSPKQSAIVSIIEMDSKNSEEIDRTSVNSLEKRWTISNISDTSSCKRQDSYEGLKEIAVVSGDFDPESIFQAAATGDIQKVRAISRNSTENAFLRDDNGSTVLHHAAANGRVQIMKFVTEDLELRELLNSQNNKNESPLHWAAFRDQNESVDFLFSHGADPTINDKNGLTALHVCCSKNSLKALEAYLKYKGAFDINERMSRSGGTALHCVAWNDFEEGAKLLLNAGAKPCIPCNFGYRPIHAAALSGSVKVMRVILDICVDIGYTPQEILSYADKELCSPLYCAVTGGHVSVIHLCLEYGARLDKQQADQSTPMHVVCAQGSLDVVKRMFEIAPKQAVATLSIEDRQKHTPLHKVAMYGHVDILKYIIDQGADMEVLDDEQNTPLLLAASRGNWECVRDLIDRGAYLNQKNKDDRNLMHMIVLKGGDIKHLDLHCSYYGLGTQSCKEAFKIPEVEHLLTEPDFQGCTPLHYACQEGNLASLDTLMSLGVNARPKSASNQSPLHFAAMYGRYNACKRLINSSQGPNIMNEKDGKGMTPLHYAAQNGHTKVVELLHRKGAVFYRNTRGESVLHVAAINGYTRTIRILAEINRTLLDLVDEEGNTALHLAARANHENVVKLLLDLGALILLNNDRATSFTETVECQNREVALAFMEHDRWEEAMEPYCSKDKPPLVPTLLLIQYLPDVWVTTMNRCIEIADCNPRSKDYWIKYKFTYLQPSIENRDQIKADLKALKKKNSPIGTKNAGTISGKAEEIILTGVALPAMNKMVTYNRVECLRHPVSLAYIHMKWKAYGRWVHALNLLVFLIGLFPLTYLIVDINESVHLQQNSTTTDDNGRITYSAFQTSMMILLLVFSCGQIIKEIVQMIQQRTKYFKDFTNALEWAMYITSLIFVVPFFTGFPLHLQFVSGACAIFLAWVNLLLFLRRFDMAGIYVVMFMEIFKTLIKVLLIFSFLMIAFSFSFFVLMRNEDDMAFSTPQFSILRVFTMTLGEISYVDKFLTPSVDNDDTTLHFSSACMVLLTIFILVMPILLMNLLIGLAVGDIAEVQNNAALQRLAMQVELHTSIEGKLSTRFLRLVDKTELVVYPNKYCGMFSKVLGFVTRTNTDMNDFNSDTAISGTDRSINFLGAEIQKQKNRIKEIQGNQEKQYDLLRLIVQKMEIRSEADDQDEGFHPDMQKRLQNTRMRMSAAGTKIFAAKALRSSPN